MLDTALNQLLRRPKLSVLIIFAFLLLSATGAKSLYFRGDFNIFFKPENPQLMAYEKMQETFSKNENASIIISPRHGDIFTPETLSLIKTLTELAWETPYSTRVDSLANFQHSRSEDGTLVVDNLWGEKNDLSPDAITSIRDIALSDPSLETRLVSNDGKVAVVDITVHLPSQDKTIAVKEVAEYVRGLSLEMARQHSNYDFHHTGVVFINHAFASEAQNDVETLVPLVLLVVIFLVGVMLRSIGAAIATTLIVITSVLATMGIAGWAGIFMSTATINVPIVVMTLAVADCIHIASYFLHSLSGQTDRRTAVVQAVRNNISPVFLTSTTTAIGFLMLNFSEVPVLSHFGNLSALGVMIAFVLSITLFPLLLLFLPSSKRSDDPPGNSVIRALSHMAVAHRNKAMIIMVFSGTIATFVGAQNRLNDTPTDYFSSSTEFKQSVDFRERHLGGMSPIDFAIYAEEDETISDPEFLHLIADFSDWLRKQSEVDHVVTITDTFKRLNKSMHDDRQELYRLPEDPDLAAQYLLLYEMLLPFGLDVNNLLSQDRSATRVMAMLKNLGSNEFIAFEDRAYRWMDEREEGYSIEAASPALMFAHISELNMRGMIKGTFLALLLISGLLVIALRSWRLGIISIVPNLLPAALGFGLWGIYSGEINIALSVSMSMALGIIVDDTVHFLTRYRYYRTEGMDCENAIMETFRTTGKALWSTTVILVAGFGVLAFSSFSLNSDMGIFTVAIISAALLVDFLFLPGLLLMFDKDTDYRKQGDMNLTSLSVPSSQL